MPERDDQGRLILPAGTQVKKLPNRKARGFWSQSTVVNQNRNRSSDHGVKHLALDGAQSRAASSPEGLAGRREAIHQTRAIVCVEEDDTV